MDNPFTDHRSAALALITSEAGLREKEGNFLGGLVFRAEPMTDKQANWLSILLKRHGFPPVHGGAA